jgi:tight adherence protein C
MTELLVPILVFVSVLALGGAFLTARVARREPLRARLAEDGDEGLGLQAQDGKSLLRRTAERMAITAAVGKPSTQLQEDLAKAGYHSPHAARLYLGAKVLLFVMTGAALTMLVARAETSSLMKMFVALGGATFMSFVPNVVVARRKARRGGEIQRRLPDALDLLEICVSSGMALDAAWNAVADEVRSVSPVLADEMALTNLELHLGSPRATAMRRMAERTGADEISSLAGVLVQSDKFGTSIRDALRTFAGAMREERSAQAAEDAERMAVKLLFPLVLFIFPTVLIIGVGPVGIKLVEFFRGGG